MAALLLTACADRPPAPEDAAAGPGDWTELAPAPLSPRTDALTAWTGSEALFLGGVTDGVCPPNAACGSPEKAVDGAAFDPVTQAWRMVAEAPHPVAGGTQRAVSGDRVYVVDDDRLMSYDASEDAWSVSPPIPGDTELGGPAALDGGTVAVASGEWRAGDQADQVYDPAVRTWADLPRDPLGPAFDRVVTAVPGALVLTGKTLVPDPGAEEPALVRAAVLDLGSGEWTLLDDSDQIGGWRWSWTGSRLVDPTPGGGDGGEVGNWGRTLPFGGALDPATGRWSALPGAPVGDSGGWPVEALGGPVSALDGWLYDDRDGSWAPLDRPAGAPAVPGAAVWAGEQLVVMGGLHSEDAWTAEQLTNGAWTWRPTSASESAAATDDLTGVHWVLESPVAPGTASLDFRADGTVDVATGCVEGTTRWHVTGDAVGIDEFGWYGLACSEAEFDRQDPLFDTWSSFRPTVEDDVLTLVPVADGAPTLVYRAG